MGLVPDQQSMINDNCSESDSSGMAIAGVDVESKFAEDEFGPGQDPDLLKEVPEMEPYCDQTVRENFAQLLNSERDKAPEVELTMADIKRLVPNYDFRYEDKLDSSRFKAERALRGIHDDVHLSKGIIHIHNLLENNIN